MIKKPYQHSASRRAFLRGPRVASTPWEQFIKRLQRCIHGEFTALTNFPQASAGRLIVQSNQDIYHLLDLAKLYGVKLVLDGFVPSVLPPEARVVVVVPGEQLSQLKPLDTQGHRWFICAGVRMQQLVAAGLVQCRAFPPTLTIAQWLASPRWTAYPTTQTQHSGVMQARLCLSDAVPVTLGPFASDDRLALKDWRSQALVTQLFRFTYASDVAHWLTRPQWPLRYRLDALKAREVNLAQVLLGHQGALGWLEWLVLDRRKLHGVDAREVDSSLSFGLSSEEQTAAAALQHSIKQAFDPDDIFTTCG